MKTKRTLYPLRAALLLMFILLVWCGDAQVFADGYGSIRGQFVLDGEIPQPKLLEKQRFDVRLQTALAFGQQFRLSTVVCPERVPIEFGH